MRKRKLEKTAKKQKKTITNIMVVLCFDPYENRRIINYESI